MNSFVSMRARIGNRLRSLFVARDLLFHDGTALRRISLTSRRQATLAAAATLTLGFSGYGAAQAAQLVVAPAHDARVAGMEHRLDAMQARVSHIRDVARVHAARVEQRQALITAALTGKGDEAQLALATLAIDPTADRLAADVVKPLVKVEGRQAQLADAAQKVLDQRLAKANATLKTLGVAGRVNAMGGPLIDGNSAEAQADLKADAQFRTLFQSWKKLDTLQQGAIAIPSVQPVQHLQFTSNFGIRSDPFRGTAAMHAGVDIPGPVGTPIYATADGIIDHAGRQGGYGNMVEINHGKGIATRYGHLSKILVADGAKVTRGQLIALMGSTGRSTGPHLHYEVRIDGHAVNPVPFLTTADYLLASQSATVHQIPVSTDGPAAQD